jgi:hypothetical protein
MSNLVPLDRLVKIIISKGLDKLIKEVGYANNNKNKYYVRLNNNKIVRFGDIRYEDYLLHGDEKRRKNYRQRHKHDNIDNENYSGFWSYWLLW